MSDVSFLGSMVSNSVTTTEGGGTINYDKLTNQPIRNISGTKVNLSTLDSGVYNISGTWCMCADDVERDTPNDDLFFVSNDDDGCTVTRISAGHIYTLSLPVGGTAANIEDGTVATWGDLADSMVGDFGGGA